MTLLDPEKTLNYDYKIVAKEAEMAGTSAIMVGGSTVASGSEMDEAIQGIKQNVRVPVIIFPNNLTSISKYADAIWFMSLLNSSNSYYIIDSQAIGAPTVKRFGLEALSMGYIIVGQGGAAGYIGQARGIPYDHNELAVAYSSAAELLGMKYVYLEAGSGAQRPVPPQMIIAVRNFCRSTLAVGGGIRDSSAALAAKNAGAQIIVTGTMVEEEGDVRERISEIVSVLKT